MPPPSRAPPRLPLRAHYHPRQALSDYVRRFVAESAVDKGALPTVPSVAKLLRTLAYGNKDRLMAGMIVAGWDPVHGGTVWEVPLGGACVRQPFAIGGSGSSYIYGLVDAAYRPGMGRDDALAFVRKSIAHAMARDGSSGERPARRRRRRQGAARRRLVAAHSLTRAQWPLPLRAHSLPPPLPLRAIRPRPPAAGGVIRTVIIDKDGVTRDFMPGDRLPYNLA